jgi:uncharacterized membrane protein
MKESLKIFAEYVAHGLELFGIVIILMYTAGSTAYVIYRLARGERHGVYTAYRRQIGLGILLGLEVLVAADIIQTVALDFNLRSVGVLGIVVIIRTFLSFTLTAEIEGKWPWQSIEQTNKN